MKLNTIYIVRVITNDKNHITNVICLLFYAEKQSWSTFWPRTTSKRTFKTNMLSKWAQRAAPNSNSDDSSGRPGKSQRILHTYGIFCSHFWNLKYKKFILNLKLDLDCLFSIVFDKSVLQLFYCSIKTDCIDVTLQYIKAYVIYISSITYYILYM